jgi:alpha-amylase/alpha-mannosidase (GH57 family)
MEKYVCIHGHFYQPPRENPWLEDVELQDSAYPYHDWNERITQECYAQNAASRILGPNRKIINIVNNYSKMSFDFGPTLLFWLERHAPEIYDEIIKSDRKSMEFFSGHGAAMAQAYNHMIMPLANRRDKLTQVRWGITDFESRFGRKPEGMWLPETAVDLETLDILAEHGIVFTVLSPHQARRVRRIGQTEWMNLGKDEIDTTRPYVCHLASGRSINLFFYHGPTAGEVASGRLLQNGEVFAKKLALIASEDNTAARLAHVATDGETFGHHYRYTDMALAYCVHYIESNSLAKITIYGEYMEKFPPTDEVEIYENSSWSCAHGVERWRGNCGCCYGRYPSGRQQWREPLREAMDRLRDRLSEVYEEQMAQYVSDPWEARDKYVSVINDRSIENVEAFLSECTGKTTGFGAKITILKLLEMQRNAMLMYTSCGWFFDDICGIETLQIMQYASRAIQLAKETADQDFEPEYERILAKASTNVKEFANGREVYESLVKKTSIDLSRVGAHFAMSSIFEEYTKEIDIYCYSMTTESYDRVDAGVQSLAVGRATVESRIVLETHRVDFAVLHFGDHNLIAAVTARIPDEAFSKMRDDLKTAFAKGDTTEAIRIMNLSFGSNSYSLWHLFKDQQRRILYELLATTWQEIEASFRHIFEHNYTIMKIMRGMNIPLPKALSGPAEFILNQDLCTVLQDDESDVKQLKKLANEATELSVPLDQATLRYEASHRIDRLMKMLEELPADVDMVKTIEETLSILTTITSELDLQSAQNVFFAMSKDTYPGMVKKAGPGDMTSRKWVEHFRNLGQYLGVKVD